MVVQGVQQGFDLRALVAGPIGGNIFQAGYRRQQMQAVRPGPPPEGELFDGGQVGARRTAGNQQPTLWGSIGQFPVELP